MKMALWRTIHRAPSLGTSLRSTSSANSSLLLSVRTFSVLDRVGGSIAASVAEKWLHSSPLLQEDRLVTETRRTLERRRPMEQTLAERLKMQREVRQLLIPKSVTVDKTGLYIDFIWPLDGVKAEAERGCREGTDEHSNSGSSSQGIAKKPEKEDLCGATTARLSGGNDEAKPPPTFGRNAHRTRALAEHLRVYTPSTDGTYSANVLVYGRRGVMITDIIPVGNYALRIIFSDGHTGGIYAYDYLYYLTSPGNKYRLMREYVIRLRENRKSRDPPRRAKSRRQLARSAPTTSGQVSEINERGVRHAGSGAFSKSSSPCFKEEKLDEK